MTRASVLFSGQTQLLTPGGVLPLGFDIEAATLEEALNRFPEAVKLALDEAIEEAREMRREQASRIVVPDAGAMGGGPGRRRQDQIPLISGSVQRLLRRRRQFGLSRREWRAFPSATRPDR